MLRNKVDSVRKPDTDFDGDFIAKETSVLEANRVARPTFLPIS
jgi:hypothetical protein